MHLTEKTQQAYREYEAARKTRRAIAKTINETKATDETLTELEAAKKQAAGEYRAEADQFQAKHARLFEKRDAAKAAEQDAKGLFDDLYVHLNAENIASKGAVQLSLFADDGRKVNVELVTKVTVEKAAHEPVSDALMEELQEEAEGIIQRGLEDVAAGRVSRAHTSVDELVADLRSEEADDPTDA